MEHKEGKNEHDSYISKTKGFFHYVFNTDHDTKTDLTNLAQYIFLAFVFVTILINTMRNYFPIIDDSRSSIEILIIVMLYMFILFYGIYYINRVICYIPNFSGSQYSHCGSTLFLFPLVLSVLISITNFSPQAEHGTCIIIERMNEVWESKPTTGKKKKKSSATQQQQEQPQQPQHSPNIYTPPQQMAPTLYSGQTTPISQLPVVQMNSQEGYQNSQSTQDNGFESQQLMEPMAANEGSSAFGGAFGSTW